MEDITTRDRYETLEDVKREAFGKIVYYIARESDSQKGIRISFLNAKTGDVLSELRHN